MSRCTMDCVVQNKTKQKKEKRQLQCEACFVVVVLKTCETPERSSGTTGVKSRKLWEKRGAVKLQRPAPSRAETPEDEEAAKRRQQRRH